MFKSIHELAKVGALIYHDLPVHFFFQHGMYRYSIEFFSGLIAHHGYRVIMLRLTDCEPDERHYTDERNYVCVVAAYQKTEDIPFMSFEEFAALPGLVSVYDHYMHKLSWSLKHNRDKLNANIEIQFDLNRYFNLTYIPETCESQVVFDYVAHEYGWTRDKGWTGQDIFNCKINVVAAMKEQWGTFPIYKESERFYGPLQVPVEKGEGRRERGEGGGERRRASVPVHGGLYLSEWEL